MPALRTFLGCLLILSAARLTAADPPPAKDKEKDKEPPAEKLVATGQPILGTLQNWNESEGKFTLHVKFKYAEQNQQAINDYLREQQNFQNRQVQILQNRDPRARQQEMNKLYQDMANFQNKQWNFLTVKEKEQNIDVEVLDEAKVRLASPPAIFDEKGNVKQYTKEELKELKGTDNLPGYPGERDALRNGQTVLVTFGYKSVPKKVPDAEKKDPEKKEPEKKEPEKKDVDKKDPEKKVPPAPPKPKVIQVLIVAEPKG